VKLSTAIRPNAIRLTIRSFRIEEGDSANTLLINPLPKNYQHQAGTDSY
jgi:hypothetical protein